MRREDTTMMRNRYWDLYECCWVEYSATEPTVSAADAVPVPRSANQPAEVGEARAEDAGVAR